MLTSKLRQPSVRLMRLLAFKPASSPIVRCRATETDKYLDAPDVKGLAKMAQIDVSDQEVQDWEPKIKSIVQWFGQLQQVDTANVEPAIHGNDQASNLRQDQPVMNDARTALLAQAPLMENSFIRVPKAAGENDELSAAPSSPAGGAPAAAATEPTPVELNFDALKALDIRVGKILSCELHPDADSLYLEKIDVGEEEPRTIISGLVKYVPIEQMQNRMVLVLCNLKPRSMRGIKSNGMVLAASDVGKENVQPLQPPEDALVGERVWFGEDKEQPAPSAPNATEKKKLWDKVMPGMKTDDSCVAVYGDKQMMTSAGAVKAASLAGARIA